MTPHQILWKTLRKVVRHTRPGVRTLTLSNLADVTLKRYGAVSYMRGYKPLWAKSRFPAALSVSVNNEIAYGFPNQYRLQVGDIVSYQLAVRTAEGYATGTITVPVGKVDKQARTLLKSAKMALEAGKGAIRDGVKVRDVAEAIEKSARSSGFVVNRTFTGHQIGKELYMDPYIYHAKNWLLANPQAFQAYEHYLDMPLKAGMVLVIQPTLSKRDAFGTISGNRWTWITRDRRRAATFSQMLEVTANGCVDIPV
jgi:methionyl aminopeptidase